MILFDPNRRSDVLMAGVCCVALAAWLIVRALCLH